MTWKKRCLIRCKSILFYRKYVINPINPAGKILTYINCSACKAAIPFIILRTANIRIDNMSAEKINAIKTLGYSLKQYKTVGTVPASRMIIILKAFIEFINFCLFASYLRKQCDAYISRYMFLRYSLFKPGIVFAEFQVALLCSF